MLDLFNKVGPWGAKLTGSTRLGMALHHCSSVDEAIQAIIPSAEVNLYQPAAKPKIAQIEKIFLQLSCESNLYWKEPEEHLTLFCVGG